MPGGSVNNNNPIWFQIVPWMPTIVGEIAGANKRRAAYPDSKVHGANMGSIWGPMWAPCWPHEPCYLGRWVKKWSFTGIISLRFPGRSRQVLLRSEGQPHHPDAECISGIPSVNRCHDLYQIAIANSDVRVKFEICHGRWQPDLMNGVTASNHSVLITSSWNIFGEVQGHDKDCDFKLSRVLTRYRTITAVD